MGLAGSPPPRVSLHTFVADYLYTQAYASTSRLLAQPRTRAQDDGSMDVDGDGVDGAGAGGRAAHGVGWGNGSADGADGVDGAHGAGGAGGSSGRHGMDLDGVDSLGNGHGEAGVGAPGDDAGGLSERALVSCERRSAILNHILNGAIDRAVRDLDAFFPAVLAAPDPPTNGHAPVPGLPGPPSLSGLPAAPSLAPTPTPTPARRTPTNAAPPAPGAPGGAPAAPAAAAADYATPVFAASHAPAHLRLNLRVQQFIESFRALAPSDPASPSSSFSSVLSSSTANGGGGGGGGGGGLPLTHALTAAQGLHAEAKKLPPADRAVYLQEIKDVGALFAYAEPEKSILGGFLAQARRIALARQVNGAILQSEGRPTQSFVERVARRTSALYAILAERDIDPQPLWEHRPDAHTVKPADAQDWRLASLLRHTNLRDGFSLRDYVEQGGA